MTVTTSVKSVFQSPGCPDSDIKIIKEDSGWLSGKSGWASLRGSGARLHRRIQRKAKMEEGHPNNILRSLLFGGDWDCILSESICRFNGVATCIYKDVCNTSV